MTRERLKELWPVMEHFKNGGEVERRLSNMNQGYYWFMDSNPDWNDPEAVFRIAQPKPMTFMGAVEAMKHGEHVKRKIWRCSVKIGTGGHFQHNGGSTFPFCEEDIEATDWEVVK